MGVVVCAPASTKLRPMVLSLNIANVFVGLKAGNRFATFAFTLEKVD